MSIREKILDAAEARMRAVGYNATSFRDVASDVGVKSASVHYHFPQKEDLGAALMERYTKRQFETLEAATDGISDPAARVEALITLHSDAFAEGERICLCAMLSAESISLPNKVAEATQRFLDGSLAWLRNSFSGDPRADTRAESILAILQGALIISGATRDGSHFARAAAGARALSTATI